MRGLVRVKIVEKDKRAVPIDVTKFMDISISLRIWELGDILEYVGNNIRYVPDQGKEFWKFPAETLADKVGDCEDGAILTAALMLARNIAPYYEILVNVFDTGAGFHVAVTVDGRLMDWTRPTIYGVPPDWKLWYCFNRKHAYTTRENAEKWRS